MIQHQSFYARGQGTGRCLDWPTGLFCPDAQPSPAQPSAETAVMPSLGPFCQLQSKNSGVDQR